VWSDIKQRRLWPVYIEYLMGVLWAHSLFFLVLVWLAIYAVHYFFGPGFISDPAPLIPIIPKWTGAILGLVFLLQVIVSLFIDIQYESKSSFKYYFWAIWYPFFYWLLSALTVIGGVFNVFIRRDGVSITWESPDRGLHTLK